MIAMKILKGINTSATLSVFIFLGFFLTLSALTITRAHADIYQFVAEDGTQFFTDDPQDPRYKLYLKTLPSPVAGSNTINPTLNTTLKPALLAARKRSLDSHVTSAAHASRLDPALLHALIEVESSYNTKAVSPKGARGLMQLMPATGRRYGLRNAFDAADNLQAGASYLRDLLDMFPDDLNLALAAYNAGENAVLKYGRRIPPYAETQRYVQAVALRYRNNLSSQ